ncbi:MAG: hypothetical protein GDA41_06120 [Rhodospirillales bacterium]|nr:hypothetical protein [Rhodospirillales bacterium]
MKAFLCSLLAIVVISAGAFAVLDSFDSSAAYTYSDRQSVRLDSGGEAATRQED